MQVEEFFYVAKSKDYDVERWTEEDLLEHQLPPHNSHHRTSNRLFTIPFRTMQQTATTLIAS